MFGTAAAITYAFTAALIKTVSDFAAHDWVTLFVHWQTYGVIVFGLLGLFLTQNAFHAGPLAASQSTLVLVDPLVSICLGIALYGDSLRTSGPYGPLEAISLLLMFVGAVFLSHSPLITGMKSEGKGVEYDEMLSRAAEAPAPQAPGRTRHRACAGARARQRPAPLLLGLAHCSCRPPFPHQPRHGGEVIGMGQVRAVLRPLNTEHGRPRHVLTQPLHAASVVR